MRTVGHSAMILDPRQQGRLRRYGVMGRADYRSFLMITFWESEEGRLRALDGGEHQPFFGQKYYDSTRDFLIRASAVRPRIDEMSEQVMSDSGYRRCAMVREKLKS